MKSANWPQAFNEMTRQLAEQRERLVQTERVAAWRELARRLAHELKNPLFPAATDRGKSAARARADVRSNSMRYFSNPPRRCARSSKI